MPSSSGARPTEDRRGQILQEVLRSEFVTVASLARQFDLSEVSIRRNLEQLEQAGLIRRVHGGAKALTRPGQPSVYDARLLQRLAEKRAIGRAAAALIRPGETLFLDSGTTVLEVARAIPEALLERGGLPLVTRSLVIVGELRRYRQVRLMVLGGIYVDDFVLSTYILNSSGRSACGPAGRSSSFVAGGNRRIRPKPTETAYRALG